ncbi:hypothetical protein V6N12_008644 [Hibiscus sabdariffa]|uniref:Uncharacterized protein n=1 Tax=Hibiscus sabdariffa TaxID=183260 RepID=A0ABR2BJH3_9ROSI
MAKIALVILFISMIMILSIQFVVGDEPSTVPITSVSKVSDDFEVSLAPSLPKGDVAAAAGPDASSSAPASTPKTTRKF